MLSACFFFFFLSSRAKVESRNNLETYLYNLKSSYEDSLKDKIAENDLEELKTAVEAGLEVCMRFTLIRHAIPPPPLPRFRDCERAAKPPPPFRD